MNIKTKNPSFAGLFLLLSDKRNQLDKEAEKHPTGENKANANSLRLIVMQMCRIMFDREDRQRVVDVLTAASIGAFPDPVESHFFNVLGNKP